MGLIQVPDYAKQIGASQQTLSIKTQTLTLLC
jgi:hypothetical protein